MIKSSQVLAGYFMQKCIEEGLARMPAVLPTEPSLLYGKLGLVVLYAYAYKLLKNEVYWTQAEQNIEAVIELMQDDIRREKPDISTFANLGRLIPILKKDNIVDLEMDSTVLLQLDELVFEQTKYQLRNNNIDYLAGAAGGLNYLGTRIKENKYVSDYLNVLIKELDSTKIKDSKGTCFYNSYINNLNGSTSINMGFAHGQWGLLTVLLSLYELNQCKDELGGIVESMLDYIIKLKRPPQKSDISHSYFPHVVLLDSNEYMNDANYSEFTGWCYGDLPAALTLYKAHRILGKAELRYLADEVGTWACNKLKTNLQPMGTDLCHGSASLVNCYSALHRVYPRPCYKRERNFWLKYTIEKLQKEFHSPTDMHSCSLLQGNAGTILTLISECPKIQTSWQELFLL